MGKPDPQKRKPLHATAPLDEITDNVKNSAVVTRSKLKKKMLNNQSNDNNDDSDVITSDSGSEDEKYNSFSKRIHFEEQIRTKLNVNVDNRELNENYLQELEERIKKAQAKTQLKSQANVDSNSRKRIKQTKIAKGENSFQNLNASSKKGKNDTNYMLYIVAFIFIVPLLYYFNGSEVFATNNYNNNMKEISETDHVKSVLNDVLVTLKSMQSKYKNQKKELWKNAYMAISNIIRDPKKPSIIILLGDKSDPLDCLAVLLGNVSSNALNTESLLLTPEKFDADMGTVIESLKFNVQNKKAVIIWDLLNINTEALRAFHNLCDRINPLVEEVIYIITIIADGYDKESNPLEFVEKELFKKLSGKIKKDAIQPLITRITDGPILTVKPEPNMEDCPLPKATKRI